RDLVDNLQVGGDEVGLETLPAYLEYPPRLEEDARHGHDGSHHVLLSGRAGCRRHAVDEHVGHGRMLGDQLLDEPGVDEVAVLTDAAALAVVEVEPALPVAVAHVAAAKPAARGLGLRRGRVTEILHLCGLAGPGTRHDLAHAAR